MKRMNSALDTREVQCLYSFYQPIADLLNRSLLFIMLQSVYIKSDETEMFVGAVSNGLAREVIESSPGHLTQQYYHS